MLWGEVLGMSEKRMVRLKRILDNAIKCIVKKPSFCRLRAYRELDIDNIYIKSSASRTRALIKWEWSHGLISELLALQTTHITKNKTWAKQTTRWLKTMSIDYQTEREVAIKTTKNKRRRALIARDKSKASQFAWEIGATSSMLLRKLEIHQKLNSVGVNALSQLRTSTFSGTNIFIRAKKIDIEYLNKCFFCNRHEKDNARHILLECDVHQTERDFFQKNRAKYSCPRHQQNPGVPPS